MYFLKEIITLSFRYSRAVSQTLLLSLEAKLYKRLWCFKIERSTYKHKNII